MPTVHTVDANGAKGDLRTVDLSDLTDFIWALIDNAVNSGKPLTGQEKLSDLGLTAIRLAGAFVTMNRAAAQGTLAFQDGPPGGLYLSLQPSQATPLAQSPNSMSGDLAHLMTLNAQATAPAAFDAMVAQHFFATRGNAGARSARKANAKRGSRK